MRLLTTQEAAERLRLSAYTVREMLRTDELRGSKLGSKNGRGRGEWRIEEKAVDEYLRRTENIPAPRRQRTS